MKTSESGVGRRNFIKAMAATGVAAAVGKAPLAPLAKEWVFLYGPQRGLSIIVR